jgi:hypothetical protein
LQGKGVAARSRRSRALPCIASALLAAAALALSACGGGGSDGTEAVEPTTQKPPTSGFAYGGKGGKHEGSAAIAAQFPEPKPPAGAPAGAQREIDAGRKACKGKTPAQIRDRFLAEAEASGALNPGQERMVANIEHFEKQVTADFVAGQLAAGVFEATQPERIRIYGYQGCVYELAQQLQREIAKGKKAAS